jgi:hypothetical protein
MPRLLAIDLGLRAGLAVYRGDGRLESYGSRNFGSRARLKRAVLPLLGAIPELAELVLEGDRALGELWQRAAVHVGARVTRVSAETWRAVLLLDREQHDGRDAKHFADVLARRVITWSGAPEPTSLRHDAAEAILIGLWWVLELGWLGRLPAQVTRR